MFTAKMEEIKQKINNLNPKKVKDPDKISPKIVKLAANILLTYI